jgi:RHS repeat-associated protein
LVSQWQGGETFWYHLDALGSTIALTDESGKIRNRYGYDEYGNPLSSNSEEVFNRFTFTGQAWDAGVGLYNYKARYYNPAIARFLTQDTWKGTHGSHGHRISIATWGTTR